MFDKSTKLLDCTVRDGGLINKWHFSKDLVRSVYKAVNNCGVDYMEIGYRASEKMFPPGEYGPWRHSKDDLVKEIIECEEPNMKLGVMVDIGRVEEEDIAASDESPLDFMRVATYLKDIDKAIALAKLIEDKGYESFINIMAISAVNDFDLAKGLRQIEEETNVTAVTVVDSFGALHPKNVDHLINIYKDNLSSKVPGIHAHNSLQLGFANTIQGLDSGAKFCDATINGIGRGAGNCPLELMLSYLKNPKYEIEPVLQCLEEKFVDLRTKIEWGYIIPYMITGILNEHPRSAMALRNSENKDKYTDFYRKMTTPECPEDEL